MRSCVAVIIRTKNRGRLLGRALDSVLNQTYTDWRVVLVNDGGDPAQVDEALEPRRAQFGDRLMRLDNEASLGMEAASNLGIRAVDSEYIAVHDDDDEWDPDFLSTTVAYLDEHPDQGGVSVETEIVFERLTRVGREVEERVPLEPQMKEITLVDLLHYNRFVPISFLFRRSVYDEIGGFDENLAVVGDWEFHLRFLVHHHIGLIKGRPLAFWNQRRSARDTEANSVISALDEHQLYSLKVRDRLVREHAREYGLGPLLYQRELLAVETNRIHHRMDDIANTQNQSADQINRMVEDLDRLQRTVWSASQPLLLRAARSIRRRLAERRSQPDNERAVVSLSATHQGPGIAILGDIGQGQYHVGDEAMAHAAIDELQKRGFDNFVVLSHDVEQTTELFGHTAAPRPQVPWNAYERHQILQDIKDLLAGHASSDKAPEIVRIFQEAFAGCHALFLAGGGNLTSQYGGLLFERLAAIHVAHAMGLKILVSGQTVGPVLTEVDRTEVSEALLLCDLVGSRERHTHDLLSVMGVDSLQVLDDATFLEGTDSTESFGSVPGAYIVATFAPGSGAMKRHDYHRHMARLLDLVYEEMQLPILLLPHVSTIGETDGDQECHQTIARLAKTSEIILMSQGTATETAALTRGAELVISSRYHPIIFALSGAVPVLPLAVDHYGEVRLGGALENWGVGTLLRSLRHLGDDDIAWIRAVANGRAQLSDYLKQRGQELLSFQNAWWDTVSGLLGGSPAPYALSPLPMPVTEAPLLVESPEHDITFRLNASNEIAIGLLAQHGDWLQGRLNELERQRRVH
ncbi:UNVERIFIED_ORG: polysaccharide pyruvyl transferase WcaK-like protein/glycosyltransferase involved in cell wall biosynthesis [Arthrobacter sp. UYEF10]